MSPHSNSGSSGSESDGVSPTLSGYLQQKAGFFGRWKKLVFICVDIDAKITSYGYLVIQQSEQPT